ncbi:alpha/beta fold hydrolase [Propylenella binzhouense]|uniref:Alpha/beta fold hydrolase n=1 Tax=Propylenella binzhouense TaxID=2555902 RepID=A0A964T4B2_9HYPH|nr:alpha/beta fold hydrolase [Propylenella binzhouense]MYZ47654.1 alpha/beta fold hydrolase [Propylenella binzhouense]
MKDGFVETAHGRIHYLEAGSGKPIILLHSNGNSAYEYDHLIERLAGKHRAIAWDQPGHGDSDRIVRHYSVEDYSDAVVAFMDALGIDKANVLGASIGGMICTDLGARHADRIDHLFVVEAPARSQEEWAAEWLRTERNWTSPVQAMDQLTPRFRNVTPEFLERWNIDRQKAGAWTMLDVMWALRLYDSRGAIPKVTAKTMAIFGENNRIKAYAPLYEAGIPGVRIELMKDCGHFPMVDDPEALAKLVDDFVGA